MSIVDRRLTHDPNCPFRDDQPHQNSIQDLVMLRGVEHPCHRCAGLGVRAYADTSTWRGGIGGQSITQDTCDLCWGTGDQFRLGANLKQLRAICTTMHQALVQARATLKLADEARKAFTKSQADITFEHIHHALEAYDKSGF